MFIHCSTVLLLTACFVTADHFAAIAHLEQILQAESKIVRHLQEYISKEKDRLSKLQALANNMAVHNANGIQDPQSHLGNPINAFHLVKRFSVDWNEKVNILINNSNAAGLLALIEPYLENLPNNNDLDGSAKGLFRLQDTYNLVPDDLARGKILNINDTIRLSAHDCFRIGKVAFENDDFYHAIQWLLTSLTLLNEEEEKSIEESDILSHLSNALYQKGNIYHAWKMTKRWLSLLPNDIQAKRDFAYYDKIMKKNEINWDEDSSDESKLNVIQNNPDKEGYYSTLKFKVYEALCRGETLMHRYHSELLTCQYQFWHPMFYVRPLREEVLSNKPWIAVYHQIITEDEMEHIKLTAVPKLHRSEVIYQETGIIAVSEDRISKQTKFEYNTTPIIARVHRKLSALTNLSLSTADDLSVINYGIGGHFEPHLDFSTNDILLDPNVGNRILTAILYMSDVQAGGGTVFLRAGIRVQPEKGSIAVWYNLKASGEKDYLTLHAGCPVLVGTKWVATKWFRERDQEFRRPCGLTP